MLEQGLKAIRPKSFVPKTTQSHPHLKRRPNLLLIPDNQPIRPNQVIVGDITYLLNKSKSEGKWLYLAVWLDLFSRRIVGWHLDCHMEDTLIINAFKKVVHLRQNIKQLIVHSDGGSQYSSMAFRKLLTLNDCRQSMTRKDNHYDNATAESLFSRFKTELLNDNDFYGLQDAKIKTFEYIDGYYNTIRRHSSIGYLSPIQFEESKCYPLI